MVNFTELFGLLAFDCPLRHNSAPEIVTSAAFCGEQHFSCTASLVIGENATLFFIRFLAVFLL